MSLIDLINRPDITATDNKTPIGQVAVLSVGRGDMKINFDSDDPEEVEKARIIVQDMLQRGYMIYIEVDGEQIKVNDFDPEKDEYIVKIDKRTKLWKDRDKEDKPKKSTTKRVSAKKATGTAIAPTGGG